MVRTEEEVSQAEECVLRVLGHAGCTSAKLEKPAKA